MANKRKATFQPYDMDTAAGTNNSGVLMFGYALEDTDTVSSIISGGDNGGRDAPVFNAQDSVLWNNFRDCFRSEITQMYRSLRTSKALDYKDIMQRRHDHQSYWPEAMFNEDQYEKHLVPLINPVTVDDTTGELIRTDRYLTMIQGSKEEQFKWWLYNRFRYMDSKFVTGDAANNIISMRVFNSGTLTLTPAIDLYVGVSFGGGTTVALKRTTAGVSKSFVYQAETGVTEMETWIYSGDLIANLGDLSVFYGNEFDLSKATRLRRLKIGDPAANYSNTNLVTLDLRNMGLLEYVDLRNCPNLAIPINLEGSPRLEEAYFDGTAITGVDLAEGGSIETLHLPGTIATLTLINLSKLDDFQCPSFANVSRLMLSNMDQDVIDPIDVLSEILPNSQVNIQGLYLECENAQEIEGFLNILDTMQGVSRERGANGEWLYHDYDTAQVSGTIHTSSLTGAQIASYNARYPYITVTADHVTSYLTYASYDGTTTYKTVTCLDGVPQDTAPANPTRPATAANTYTFVGWSKSMNATTADADAQTGVIADRTIYAAYTAQARTYTVRFYNGSTLLETDTGVPYGGSTTYNGATPVSPDGSAEDYPFEGWNPTPTNIQGDTSCYAQFGSPVEVVEITDSWDTINANIDNGTYATKYKIGNYKPIDLGTEGTINMQIVAFDADELADGSGYAPITFLAKELLTDSSGMNSTGSSTDSWKTMYLYSYLNTTIANILPSSVKSRIQTVNKTSCITYGNDETSEVKLFIPSAREMLPVGSTSKREKSGVTYDIVYSDNNSRIKSNRMNPFRYWLRSRGEANQNYFLAILQTGELYASGYSVTTKNGICFGFCLGLASS